MKTLAIIPCYNEEGSLEATVSELKVMAPGVDFIIINDGSSDNTRAVCEKNRYRALHLPFNLGLHSAVQLGMRYACDHSYDRALQFDGDGQHRAEYIAVLEEVMSQENADIVIGSRYLEASKGRGFRGMGSGLLSLAIRLCAGKTITDPTSGMRLYNRKMIENFATKMNYGPEPDTIAYLVRHGAKVREVQVAMNERKAGRSYLGGFSAISYMFRMFVSILFIHWFREG